MLNTRFARFSRLTALGLSVSLFGLTLSPLASAQGAADPKAKPEATKPATPAAPKPADAKPATKPADAAGTTAKPADAKPPSKKTRDAARKNYGDGEKAFASADFVAAYAAFEKAYALIPSPHAEYWMAKSLEGQGRTEEAIAAYEKYLANPEAAKVGDDKVADAKTRIEELKLKLVAQVDVVTMPANATVAVDGAPEAGTTPLTLKLAPGPHKITVSAPGYETKEFEVQANAGEKTEQKIELVKPPPPPPPPPEPVAETPPPPPPPPPPEKRSMVPAFVTLGIAAAGAAVGTVFGLQALSAKSDFDDNPTTEAADDTERNALIADMAFGVAITLGVTGIVLLTSGDEAPKEAAPSAKLHKLPPRVQVEVDGYASKTGGGAAARLRF